MVQRDVKSALYRQFGVFGCQNALESQGVAEPARQIVVIARFIEMVMGGARVYPAPDQTETANAWMTETLVRAIPSLLVDVQAEPLPKLFARSLSVLDWQPLADFAELLHIRSGPDAYELALGRLGRRGFTLGELNLLSIEDEFVRTRLPNAAKTFDIRIGIGKEVHWLAQVFFRFVLKQVLRDRKYRKGMASLDQFTTGVTANDVFQEVERAGYLSRLRASLADLPEPEATAVRLYYGIGDGREATIKDVARSIHSSEYLARVAVMRGMARLMVRLNIRGLLTREEFELIRLLYQEGLDLKAASDRLGINLNDARRLGARIGSMLRSVLRPRT